MSRKTKRKASLMIVLAFSVSIAILIGRLWLQLMLLGMAFVLLIMIWRIKELPES